MTAESFGVTGGIGTHSAPYMITLVRLRYRPETKAYIQRRQADGLSKREAIGRVKRYVARQTYHAIRADLAA
jgi:transposase